MKKKTIITLILATAIISATAGYVIAKDAHCHSRPCHASCRCCDPYRPNECSRCGAHCGSSD